MALVDHSEGPPLSDVEFRQLCELFRSHCGLHFGEESRYVLEKRLGRRLRELELSSYAAYHYHLRSGFAGDEELARAIDELTTNETYFFRERSQLRALVEEILPEVSLARRPRAGAVSIWSAGCSSGEEPYSIAILAQEAGFEPGRDIHVYAGDISRRMLQKARRGLYREASFRQTEESLRRRYFAEKDGQYRICDDIKKHVDFIHLNLVDRSKIALLGSVDVILCRNVIIYFDLETRRRVIESFHQRLRPGGYLLLGHSESLISVSNAFELCHLRNDLVYRKPIPGEPPRDCWHAAAAAAITRVDGGGGVE